MNTSHEKMVIRHFEPPQEWHDSVQKAENKVASLTTAITKAMRVKAFGKVRLLIGERDLLQRAAEEEQRMAIAELTINHPPIRDEFHSEVTAALHLAYYWQGPLLSEKHILDEIKNASEPIFGRAMRYALQFTQEGSDEHNTVTAALLKISEFCLSQKIDPQG